MNKKEFLSKLEKRLAILSEEERKDTINEYESILSEKIKNGTLEKEAVKDFGDFDELVKEILTAYKINPNASKSTKEKTKEFLDSGEELIKDGAKKLSEATDKIVDDIKNGTSNFDTDKLTSIIIKCICLVGGFAILSLVLGVSISAFGNIFEIGFWPTRVLFKIGSKLLGSLIFIAGIYLLITIVLKDTINKNEKGSKMNMNEKTTKKNNKEIGNEKNKECIKSNTDTASEIFISLAKVFVILAFIVPAVCVIVGLSVALSIVVYFIIKGTGMYGVALLLTGIIAFISNMTTAIFRGIFSHKKISIYPFIVSIILIIVGSFMTFDYFVTMEYIDGSKETNFKTKTETLNINGLTIFEAHNTRRREIQKIVNEEYVDGIITISYDYNDGMGNYFLEKIDNRHCLDDYDDDDYDDHDEYDNRNCRKTANIIYLDNDFNGNTKKIVEDFFDSLKNKKVYLNNELFKNIKITGNSKTLELIKID